MSIFSLPDWSKIGPIKIPILGLVEKKLPRLSFGNWRCCNKFLKISLDCACLHLLWEISRLRTSYNNLALQPSYVFNPFRLLLLSSEKPPSLNQGKEPFDFDNGHLTKDLHAVQSLLSWHFRTKQPAFGFNPFRLLLLSSEKPPSLNQGKEPFDFDNGHLTKDLHALRSLPTSHWKNQDCTRSRLRLPCRQAGSQWRIGFECK